MYVTIEDFKGYSLSRAEKLLAGIPGGIEKASKAAATRAASFARTRSTKAIQERYALSPGIIRQSGNVTISYQLGGGVVASVLFSGHKIPLYKYHGSNIGPVVDTGKKVPIPLHGADRVRWILAHPGAAARGHILTSTGAKKFENAFVAQVGKGADPHVGIFEQTGGTASTGNEAIREIMGLSNAQMIGNEEVLEKLSEDIYKKYEERLDHEVSRIIGGR